MGAMSHGPKGLRRGIFGASGARWPGFLALLLLCGLAACAGNGPTSPARHDRFSDYGPPGPPSDPWGPYIREASARFDVPDRWIREVMRQESGGRPNATSRVGAMGLMQVMPGTYREIRGRVGDLGDDPYHPWNSIMAGTFYLRQMYDLYGSPAFLAAYNAGPRRLEDYLWGGRGLPNETRNYVARIGPRIEGSSPGRRAAPEVYAAAEIPTNIAPGPRRMERGTMLALREQRTRTDPGIQVASLPPGPVVRMEPIGQREEPAAPLAVAAPRVPPAAAPTPRGLGLIGTAQAGTLPRAATPPAAPAPSGRWAVQVGAFASQNLARAAAEQAQAQVGLPGLRTQVTPVATRGATLYRARLTGLSPEAARLACERLARRGNCTVLSPDAQG
jgi:cell division septation protein DedD